MKFIKKIREKLGLNYYKMSHDLGFSTVQGYITFENTKYSLNADKLIKLWRLSGMSAKAFLEMIEDELKSNE